MRCEIGKQRETSNTNTKNKKNEAEKEGKMIKMEGTEHEKKLRRKN